MINSSLNEPIESIQGSGDYYIKKIRAAYTTYSNSPTKELLIVFAAGALVTLLKALLKATHE